jgi:hypothetical protein
MRPLAILMLALVPILAGAGNDPNCHKLTRQIEHFEGVVEMAQERDNELWEQETRRHIERLEERRADRCPEYAKSDNGAVQFANMVKKAAKLAAAYFMPKPF